MSSLASDPKSIFEFAENYHLLPFVIVFLLVGAVSMLVTGVKSCFRFFSEVVEAYYDFKTQCVESKRRHEEAVAGKR